MSFTDDNKDDTALTVEMTNKADTTFISDLQRKLCNCFYAHPLQQKENVFYSNGYFYILRMDKHVSIQYGLKLWTHLST